MAASLVLELMIASLQHASELSALFQKATAEGRDLTPEEVASVRAKAQASIDKLSAEA